MAEQMGRADRLDHACDIFKLPLNRIFWSVATFAAPAPIERIDSKLSLECIHHGSPANCGCAGAMDKDKRSLIAISLEGERDATLTENRLQTQSLLPA